MKDSPQIRQKIIKKMPPFIIEIARIIRNPVQRLFLRGVYNRIRQLEYKAFNRRYYAVDQVTEYLIGAQVPGDYCEFGVYQGTTFSYAYKMMSRYFEGMRFVAFDSFQGLPQPQGIDSLNGYSSHFYQGQFETPQEDFTRNLKRNKVDLLRVVTVKGWFDDSLSPVNANRHGIEKIAVAWIDCDLYESTVPVLEYIRPRLSQGSVIVFDDWRCYRNHPDFGEQRACREWLDKNPELSIAELFSFGWNGIVFTVTSC